MKAENVRVNIADRLASIAERFKSPGKVTGVRAFGNGNVNDTFLVTLDSPAEGHFVLQRINMKVFLRPEVVMRNMRTFTEHACRRLQGGPLSGDRRWEVPRVLLTQDGRDHWLDAQGSPWRAISFIGGTQSFDAIQDIDHAAEVGRALGMFHTLLSDLPPHRLAETLEGFHVTPRYLRHYEEVLSEYRGSSSPEMEYCSKCVNQRRPWVHVLEKARARGRLRLRPIHGDPKVNNILMDAVTGQAVSMVDLDTVQPGLVQYDIGDCLRSGCNPQGEETEKWETVRFEADLCHALLQGYLAVARSFLGEHDYDYLYDAIRLIAFELGLRFFTDYLKGDVYFKARHRKHNLIRALVQFRLTESIEAQEPAIRVMVRDMR